MASHPGVRSLTAGLRCSRTVVPGAEVFSISVPPPARTNLKPPASPPALPLFNRYVLAAFLRNVHQESPEWAPGADPGPGSGATVHHLPSSSLAPTPPLLWAPRASVHLQSTGLPCAGNIMPWPLTPFPPEVQSQKARDLDLLLIDAPGPCTVSNNKCGLNHSMEVRECSYAKASRSSGEAPWIHRKARWTRVSLDAKNTPETSQVAALNWIGGTPGPTSVRTTRAPVFSLCTRTPDPAELG